MIKALEIGAYVFVYALGFMTGDKVRLYRELNRAIRGR